MKKVILILGMLIPLNVLVSCSDWLDVEPKAEIELSTMHETEQGIKDALIGCYILMSDEALYGAQMTCTFMEVLGQQFALLGSTASSYYDASRYIYTEEGTENIIDGIWSGLYNVIANVNALIEGMESNEGIMRPTAYALLRAEAYSLRAFCYLDLVRCFTPGNLLNRPEKLDENSVFASTIPYSGILFYVSGNTVYRLDFKQTGGKATAIYTHPSGEAVKMKFAKRYISTYDDEDYADYEFDLKYSLGISFDMGNGKSDFVVLNLSTTGSVGADSENYPAQQVYSDFGEIADFVFI